MPCQRGVVRVRRSGSPSRQGTCAAGGGGQCAITRSSSSRLAALSSSTCRRSGTGERSSSGAAACAGSALCTGLRADGNRIEGHVQGVCRAASKQAPAAPGWRCTPACARASAPRSPDSSPAPHDMSNSQHQHDSQYTQRLALAKGVFPPDKHKRTTAVYCGRRRQSCALEQQE